ncbi:MAG: LysR family transcriptional regulator [Alphaproteobacteria bacterium]
MTTIRGLFYLLAAAQEGSYTRAAAKLSTHQPALSKAIKELEIYTGCKLLNRVAHGVVLTEIRKTTLRKCQQD